MSAEPAADLQAAITLVRNAMRDGCYVALPGEMERAERLLAQTYVLEHPADDDEAIDEVWLRSVGFVLHQALQQLSRGNNDTRLVCWPQRQRCKEEWFIDGGAHDGGHMHPIATPKTRGDVRRLCRALGISVWQHPF